MELEKLRKRGTAQLLKNLEKATGEDAKMISEILKARGHLPSTPKESTTAVAEKVRENVGKECTFNKVGSGTVIEGTIRGLMVDKRVSLVYYRIITNLGRVYHKRVDSENLTING